MANVSFPSNLVWAFNPTFIEITTDTAGTIAKVTVGSNSIDVVLYRGTTKVQINRLLQLCFTNPTTTRSTQVSLSVSGGATGSATVVAIWGSKGLTDTYSQFANNGVRRVQYFRNFPMTLDTLTSSGISNRSVTGATTINTTSAAGNIKTVIESRSETEGAYFRWIDRFGFIQYYLFVKGSYEIKNTLADYTKDELSLISNMGYAYHTRPMYVTEENTLKVSAVNLDKDTLDYVSSIVGSPIVDLYLGDNKWLPVSVVGGTYSYSEHHLKVLQDFEISVALPKRQSQIL